MPLEMTPSTSVQPSTSSLFDTIQHARHTLEQRIIGQQALVLRLFIALLADGHLLVEGAPGLAKTSAIKALAEVIEGDFHRVQFTPDLLPGDLTGTDIYQPQTGSFHFQQGPLFHNIILADEINRAPAKVQSALLEAMAERQITIGCSTYALPDLFFVMATQNPIEQEGTYPLPEAQLDRFLMYVTIDYPSINAEYDILQLARHQALTQQSRDSHIVTISQKQIINARHQALQLHMSDELSQYIVQLVHATRQPDQTNIGRWLRFGASPRATIGLDRCARVHAWLHNRDYVNPDDIHAIAHDVLRHRILLNVEAQAEGVTTDQVIDELLHHVVIP